MGIFHSKSNKKNYNRIDQSYLLEDLSEIRNDVLNRGVVTVTDFKHSTQILEAKIADLQNQLKEADSRHDKNLSQLKLDQTTALAAIYINLEKLMHNDNVLDQKLNKIIEN